MLAAALAFCCVYASHGEAQFVEETFVVRMEGRADGVGFASRNAAIARAQRDAVEKVIVSLTGDADPGAFQGVLRNAPRFIQRYEVLRHDEYSTSTRVEIDAHILEGALQREIATIMLPRLPEAPRVQLIVGEKLGEDEVVAVLEHGLVEQSLRERLERQGFDMRGLDALNRRYAQSRLMEAVTGGVEEGGALARECDADAVIVGAAICETESAEGGANVLRNRAIVTLRVYRALDGKLMDEIGATAVVYSADAHDGGEQAIRDASMKLVGPAAVASVITVLSRQDAQYLSLTVHNPGDRTRLEALANALRGELWAHDVELLFADERLARFRVEYHGSVAHLVDTLEAGRYAGARIEVKRAVGRDIAVVFE